MLKIVAAAAIAMLTLSTAAEAQQYQRHGGHGYHPQYRGGNINNSFNRNVYVKRGNNGEAWAAAGAGLLIGGILGALAAQPSYAAPPPAAVGVVPGINTVPGCYYAAFVDIYGRQFFRQICN